MAAALDPAQARQRRAYGYAWLTVCCWATVSTAFKLALAELHYAQLLFVCNAVAVLVLAMLLVASGRLHALARLPRGTHLRCLGLGLMNPVGYYLLLFQAYDILPAQVAQPVPRRVGQVPLQEPDAVEVAEPIAEVGRGRRGRL